METHEFILQAHWPGGRNSVGTIQTGQLKTQVSIPPEMNGPGIGTNPDEMLLGAAATCYIITLAAMLERASIETDDLLMESAGIVEVERGVITYKTIIHRPTILLGAACGERELEKVRKIAEKAEKNCMITRAIKGNVEVQLEATITKKESGL